LFRKSLQDEPVSAYSAIVKPRLRHVAELAGVSQATVSRVLNGRPGVAEETRREVLRALDQLGYVPVGIARARRRGLIGLIVPELDNPVFPRFAQAIESRLANEGLTTVLCTSTPAGMGEREYLDVLLDHGVDGVIVISGIHADTTADHGHYHDLRARGLPVVVVNGRPDDLDVPSVTVDHPAASRQAVAHLAALGHRRIGLALGPRRYLPSLAIEQGYLEGLQGAGLDPDPALVSETLYGIEGGHAAAVQLLRTGATGIVCSSDRMAVGAVRAVRERGGQVPGDVSVVGFDDAGPNAYLDPPLTSVQQPFEAMAASVVQLLTEPLADGPAPELRFRPELVVRASTGSAPQQPAAAEEPIAAQQPIAAPSQRGSLPAT
jgi:LacI family transcriptional regulator, repressor for deo operon, udp, cdd, tsx, nupC, and nupG